MIMARSWKDRGKVVLWESGWPAAAAALLCAGWGPAGLAAFAAPAAAGRLPSGGLPTGEKRSRKELRRVAVLMDRWICGGCIGKRLIPQTGIGYKLVQSVPEDVLHQLQCQIKDMPLLAALRVVRWSGYKKS